MVKNLSFKTLENVTLKEYSFNVTMQEKNLNEDPEKSGFIDSRENKAEDFEFLQKWKRNIQISNSYQSIMESGEISKYESFSPLQKKLYRDRKNQDEEIKKIKEKLIHQETYVEILLRNNNTLIRRDHNVPELVYSISGPHRLTVFNAIRTGSIKPKDIDIKDSKKDIYKIKCDLNMMIKKKLHLHDFIGHDKFIINQGDGYKIDPKYRIKEI